MNLNQYLDVSPEVQAALEAGKPVVGLESTIISHGMPYPKNVETALLVEQTIRDAGAVPATIERQIRKNKTRLAKKLREGAVEREVQELPYIAEEDLAETEEFRIVRRKQFSIKPMSVEEAILQMNLLDHEFFVFRDEAADGAFSVVYRRKQGGYGLIADDAE